GRCSEESGRRGGRGGVDGAGARERRRGGDQFAVREVCRVLSGRLRVRTVSGPENPARGRAVQGWAVDGDAIRDAGALARAPVVPGRGWGSELLNRGRSRVFWGDDHRPKHPRLLDPGVRREYEKDGGRGL